MYGFEEETTGLGGLAAQAPAGDRYFGASLALRNQSSGQIGTPSQSGLALPNDVGSYGVALPVVSGMGDAVEHRPGEMQPHWSNVLDFHNSPAPYILIGILLLYAWLHISVRAGAHGSVAARGGR